MPSLQPGRGSTLFSGSEALGSPRGNAVASYRGDVGDRYTHTQSRRRDGFFVRLVRGLAGTLTAGLLVLTAVVLIVSHYAPERGLVGPGSASVVWHMTGVLIAFVAQVIADRSRGLMAFLWSVIGLTTVFLVLFSQWWS